MTTTPTTTDPAIVPFTTTYEHTGPFGRDHTRYVSTDDHMDVARFDGIGVTFDVVLVGSRYPEHAFDIVASGGPWAGRYLERSIVFAADVSYADAYTTVCAMVLATVADQLRAEIG